MDNPSNPGENPATPPVATPPAPAGPPEPQAPPQPTPPSGSEPETNAGEGQPPAMVPSDRLREETEKRRKAEEERDEFRQRLEAQPQPPAQPGTDDDELDPDVERLLDNFAKKRGLVSQKELDDERLRLQVQQDVRDLEASPPTAGIPYDHRAVLQYATDNNLPITSKAALRAAYRELNWDKIMEAERQRTIAGVHESGRSGAEQPGSGGATPPSEPDVDGKSPAERTRSRIRTARQRLSAS